MSFSKRTTFIACLLFTLCRVGLAQNCELPAPDNFTVQVLPNEAIFEWQDVPGALDYHLVVTETLTGNVAFDGYGQAPLSVGGLLPVEYEATVTVVCSPGEESANSAVLYFVFQNCDLPAPDDFTVQVLPNQATFDWLPVQGALDYHLVVTLASTGAVVFDGFGQPGMTVSGLLPIEYEATVAARCSNGKVSPKAAWLCFMFIVTEDVVLLNPPGIHVPCEQLVEVTLEPNQCYKLSNSFLKKCKDLCLVTPQKLSIEVPGVENPLELLVPYEFDCLSVPPKMKIGAWDMQGWEYNIQGNVVTFNGTNGVVFSIDIIKSANGNYARICNKGTVPLKIVICQVKVGKSKTPKAVPDSELAETGLHIFPNPFSERLGFRFYIPKPGQVSLLLYDVQGRLMNAVLNKVDMEAGNFTAEADLSSLPSGSYRVALVHPGGVEVRHLVKQ